MANVIDVDPGMVDIWVDDVDDGVGIFRDNAEILHVDYRQSGESHFEISSGQETGIKGEIYNLTGGPWRAHIVINAAGRRVYEAYPRGWTIPGWNIAWQDTFVLRPR